VPNALNALQIDAWSSNALSLQASMASHCRKDLLYGESVVLISGQGNSLWVVYVSRLVWLLRDLYLSDTSVPVSNYMNTGIAGIGWKMHEVEMAFNCFCDSKFFSAVLCFHIWSWIRLNIVNHHRNLQQFRYWNNCMV